MTLSIIRPSAEILLLQVSFAPSTEGAILSSVVFMLVTFSIKMRLMGMSLDLKKTNKKQKQKTVGAFRLSSEFCTVAKIDNNECLFS